MNRREIEGESSDFDGISWTREEISWKEFSWTLKDSKEISQTLKDFEEISRTMKDFEEMSWTEKIPWTLQDFDRFLGIK